MRRTGRRPATRAAGVVVGVVAALALAGCGEVNPGAAATVDGETIPRDEVDEMAQAVCAARVVYAEQNQEQIDPRMAVYRNQVLSTLVNDQLAVTATDELGIEVPASAYERDLSVFDELFAELSADEDAALREFFVVSSRLQAATRLIGREVGGEQAAADPAAAESVGAQYLVEEAQSADVELDPRFGELTSGQVVGGSGSLSVPAAGEDAAQPPVRDLPPSQTCG